MKSRSSYLLPAPIPQMPAKLQSCPKFWASAVLRPAYDIARKFFRNGNTHTFIDTFVEEKKDIAIYIVDGHYKQDQLRIRVLDESKEVSDAITGGSSE